MNQEQLKKCSSCNEPFEWDSDVIIVEDEIYHKDCVDLYPTGYFAMIDGEPLGETENEDGGMAMEYLDEDELLDDQHD